MNYMDSGSLSKNSSNKMKNKIIQSIPALLALVVIGFSYFSQWCTGIGQICYRTILDQMIPEVTYPLYFFSLYFLPVALILIFVSRATFKSWLKLAVWMIPLAFIFIATQPVSWDGIGINFIFISRDDMARYTAEIFSIISLILIIWKYFVARHSQS